MKIQKFFIKKRALVTALTEDCLFLLFLLSTFVSSVEVILPGSMSTKIPIALIFTSFALTLVLYSFLLEKGFRNICTLSFPKITLLLALLLFFTTLFMNRNFGVTGAILQAGFLVVIIALAFSSFYKKSSN